MIDWTTIELGEAMELKRGYDLPKRKRIEGPFPIISSSGETGKHEEFKVKGPGVITGRYGTIGEVFFEKGNFWPLNTALYVKNFYRVTPRFCYYFLSDFNFDKFNDKSTVPGINRNHIHQEVIKIPPTEEQEAIAEVLSSLDDKIDLLKRQNKTLEGMAEALFRQWFIEEAQDDWEEISIYDTCSVTYGFPFKSKQFNDDQVGTPILRIRDLKNGVCCVSSPEACEDKYIIDKGDLVAGMDGEFRLYQWSGSRCHLNQRVCKFTPNQSFGSFFCYFSIGKALQYFERVKVGTTVIHLGKGDIDSIAFKVPSLFRVEEFNRQTRPYWNRINCNNDLIGNLSAQRDNLLPKLMSGEVRVQMD